MNANENSDLYWALRGGGGSNWGVITSITIKAHAMPDEGVTELNLLYSGNMC